MAKQTWNVDRKKGGTYSFNLDAQGNYTLQKDGFGSVKTLNLPELKAEAAKATTATTTKDVAKLSDQTQKAFGDVQPFYYDKKGGEGNQYTSEYQMKKEGDLATDQDMTKDNTFAQARQAMTSDAAYSGVTPSSRQPGLEVANKGITKQDTTPGWAKEADTGRYSTKKADDTTQSAFSVGRANYDLDKNQQTKTAFEGDRQWGPKPSKGMPTTRVPDRISSPLRPSIEKPTLTKTALKQVNTASNTLAKAVGIVGSIVSKSPIGAAVGLVSKAGKGISKALRGTNPDGTTRTQAEYEAARTERQQQNRTNNMIDRISKGKSTRSNPRDAGTTKAQKDAISAAIQDKARSQQGGGGNSGGRVICTELHRTGEMSTVDWIRDTRFTFKTLTKSHVKGYLFWAVPTVKLMKKYPLYRKIWKHLAQHRANDIAWRLGESKFDLLGRIYAGIGEPTCWLIGKFVSDKQYNELNLKNWRKA